MQAYQQNSFFLPVSLFLKGYYFSFFSVRQQKRLLLILCFICHASVSFGQHLLGISSSNYAGTNTLYLNPASVADARYKLYFNLVTFDQFVINNYLAYGAPYNISRLMSDRVADKYRSSRGKIIFSEDYIIEKTNGRDKRASIGADLRGPSLLFTLNEKHAFAITSRLRYAINATNASQTVAQLIQHGSSSEGIVPKREEGLHFSLNTNAFTEFGFTYGRVLVNDGDWFLKAGVTVKRLVGLYNNHLIADDASYRLVPDPDPTQKRLIVLIENITARYGYTLSSAYEKFRPTPAWIIGNRPAGSGWGADVGFVYEYRPDFRKYLYRQKGQQRFDATQNKYKYRVSVALMDIGRINYKNPAYVNRFDVVRQNLLVDENRFKDLKDFDALARAVDSTLAVQAPERQTSFASGLPTALQINVDMHLKKQVYVSYTWVHNLIGNQQVAMHQQSILAVTPRYESKWVDVAVPLALIDNYSRLSIGLAARYGPLSIGTDHLGGLLNLGNPRGVDVYFGLAVPIYRAKPESENVCLSIEKKSFLQKLKFWKKSSNK